MSQHAKCRKRGGWEAMCLTTDRKCGDTEVINLTVQVKA